MKNLYAKFELTMSKKFFVVLATSLVLANGTSTVFASNESTSDNSGSSTTLPTTRDNDNLTSEQKAAQKKLEQAIKDAKAALATKGSNSDDSGSSTTLPTTRNNKNLTGDQKAAQKKFDQDVILFKAQLQTYLVKRAEIEKTFKSDMATAGKVFNTSLKAANTNAARTAARDIYLTAKKIALQTYQNALNDLGAQPAKPGKP